MEDRVSRYPGRIKLIPVPGQPDTYDVLRADEPVVEGTPINKATLLTDSTAALLGLNDDPEVNDALVALFLLFKPCFGKYTGDHNASGSLPAGSWTARNINLGYKPSVIFVWHCTNTTNVLNASNSVMATELTPLEISGYTEAFLEITPVGFILRHTHTSGGGQMGLNINAYSYSYVAFR